MDKKDVMYGVLALVIILIIAIIIKPLATGQPVNIGLPSSDTPRPTIVGISNTSSNMVNGAGNAVQTRIVITSPPTPVPTWNAQVKTIGMVDPSSYGISTDQVYLNSTRIDSVAPYVNMTTYANFSGKSSGTTQIIHIPFPYWELWYTVDPIAQKALVTVAVTPLKGDYGSGASASDIKGSYSSVKPQFTLQVMDADDPNRIVRSITPPGGIDLNLWLGTTPTVPVTIANKYGTESSALKTKLASDYSSSEKGKNDPRPWKEKFFEGQRDYYFVIDAQNLKSYRIDIRVPTKYIGQY